MKRIVALLLLSVGIAALYSEAQALELRSRRDYFKMQNAKEWPKGTFKSSEIAVGRCVSKDEKTETLAVFFKVDTSPEKAFTCLKHYDYYFRQTYLKNRNGHDDYDHIAEPELLKACTLENMKTTPTGMAFTVVSCASKKCSEWLTVKCNYEDVDNSIRILHRGFVLNPTSVGKAIVTFGIANAVRDKYKEAESNFLIECKSQGDGTLVAFRWLERNTEGVIILKGSRESFKSDGSRREWMTVEAATLQKLVENFDDFKTEFGPSPAGIEKAEPAQETPKTAESALKTEEKAAAGSAASKAAENFAKGQQYEAEGKLDYAIVSYEMAGTARAKMKIATLFELKGDKEKSREWAKKALDPKEDLTIDEMVVLKKILGEL